MLDGYLHANCARFVDSLKGGPEYRVSKEGGYTICVDLAKEKL